MTCPGCQAAVAESAEVCSHCGTILARAPTEFLVTVDLRPGSLFHGRYEILGPLGRGGMGVVYKARDRSLDEEVAIKILRPDFAQEARMTQRFKSEIRLARKVRHRNVCAIHDFGEERGLLFISMELVAGIDLKRVLRERGRLPPEEAYELAIQVAQGLQAVHDAGIIHRDLKTPNIMRDEQGLARLMDFGIAKRAGVEGTLTGTGTVVGTPEYMSPEQGQGQKLDFRSDLYSLGVVIYELFTGRVPFKGETPISTILKHISEPPPIDVPGAALPETLKPVLRRALAKEPSRRHATARELAEALSDARSSSRRRQSLATEALEAPTLQRSRPAPARPARTARPWVLVAGLGALAAGALALWLQPPPLEPALGAARPSAPLLANPVPSLPTVGAREPAPSNSTPAPAAASHRPASAPTPGPPRATPPATTQPVAMPPTVSSPPSARSAVAPTPLPATPEPAPSPAAEPAFAGVGWLQVVVRPWGEVRVDGKVVGSTPLDKFSLQAGSHSVSVRHPAYEVVELEVLVRPEETQRVVVDLARDGVRKE